MKKSFALLIVFLLIFTFTSSNVHAQTITHFSYQVNTSSENWKEFQTKAEMVSVLRIPEGIVTSLSDEALVTAVFEYPFAVDLFLYNSYDEALDAFAKECDAYKELMSRDNSIEILDKFSQQIINTDDLSQYIYDLLKADLIQADMFRNPNMKMSKRDTFINLYTTYIYTPNGTSVSVIVLPEQFTSSDIAYLDSWTIQTYPNADFVSSSTTKYNCHSYAWYSSSTTNPYWMNYPSAYMTDGSYTRVYTAYTCLKVYYPNGNHSARMYDTYSNVLSKATLISKWGSGPVMIHNPYYSPYDDTGLTMWG